MIEINLLPEELKIKTKRPSFAIESKQILYFILLVFGILLIIQLCLAGVLIGRNYQLSILNNKWHKLEPQRKMLEAAKKEYEAISGDNRAVQQLVNQRIDWAEKLNKLSMNLPRGVWLDEISLSHKDFILKCSVLSLKKEEMSLITKFINDLKNDPGFFKDFQTLELSSVQTKTIGGYSVVDFILVGKIK